MSISYTSIFDGPKLITRKDLCQILNLNTSRPGLKFSAVEIHKSYKMRAFRFHPDKQSLYEKPIPEAICNILMHDIAQARDYMLKGEDNIPGKAFVEKSKKSFTLDSNAWMDELIQVLNRIRSGISVTSSVVPRISRFSNSFSILFFFSTFSNHQLNFRYVNVFSKELALIRLFLNDIDINLLVNIINQLQKFSESDQMDFSTIIPLLKANLPKNITQNSKFDALLDAIQLTQKELKKILTHDFIGHLRHIVQFWPNFISSFPSWTNIIGVYFLSLGFTAWTLPTYFSATKTILEVISEQKGLTGLMKSSLPLLILTSGLLPLNIMIHMGLSFLWIASNLVLNIFLKSIQLLSSVTNIMRSIYDKELSISQSVFALFESIFNLTIRLAVNLLVEILDEIIFKFIDKFILTAPRRNLNHWFDSIMHRLRPQMPSGTGTLVIVRPDKTTEPRQGEQIPVFGLFDTKYTSLHNADDVWLKQLLSNFSVEEPDIGLHAHAM